MTFPWALALPWAIVAFLFIIPGLALGISRLCLSRNQDLGKENRRMDSFKSGTISILSDNRTTDPDRFGCEHGLSVLVSTPSANILMDTGASGLYAVNAAQMSIDLSDVDYVFLSHGHSDHVGGLKTFLDLNSKAKVIVSSDAVSGSFYSGRGGLLSISCDWPLSQMQGRTIAVTDTMTLADGMHVIARIPQRHPLPSGNRLLTVRREGGLVPDDFSHEMAFYVDGPSIQAARTTAWRTSWMPVHGRVISNGRSGLLLSDAENADY